jgi:hypothetical protein
MWTRSHVQTAVRWRKQVDFGHEISPFEGTHISSQQRDVFRMYNVVKWTAVPSFLEIDYCDL